MADFERTDLTPDFSAVWISRFNWPILFVTCPLPLEAEALVRAKPRKICCKNEQILEHILRICDIMVGTDYKTVIPLSSSEIVRFMRFTGNRLRRFIRFMAVYNLEDYMSEVKSRLCGGTFFNLLLQARIRKNSPSQGKLLNSLMKIYDPSYYPLSGQNLKSIPSRFKTCDPTLNSEYVRLGDEKLARAFSARMATSYSEVVTEMKELLDGKFRDGESGKWLVRSLLELIEADPTIQPKDRLYVNPDNAASYKSELIQYGKDDVIYFYSFILGVWHYCCTRPMDAGVGQDTYMSWTVGSDVGNTERVFSSKIGMNNINFGSKRPFARSFKATSSEK